MLPTSSAARERDRRSGFALAEAVLALAIVALVAAVALPHAARSPGPSALRAAALDIASVLRGDRNAAIRQGQDVMTHVDVAGRAVISASGAREVALPRGSDLLLARGEPGGAYGVRFFPGGDSPGAAILLRGPNAAYRVDVAATGRVSVAAEAPLP